MKTKAISSFFVLFAIVAGLVVTTPAAFADHTEVTISTAPGSNTPGCETAEGCFIPKEATVDVGGKVIFSNTDTAAHTFTAGTATDGPSGEFDSGLVVVGSSYEWTPTTAGNVPFFCMVHPWMAGLIVVQEAGHDNTTTSPSDEGLMVDIATGSAGQGEKLSIDLTFTTMSGASVEHVNYDIKATQNGKVVLNEIGVHAMGNVNNHMTSPLPTAATETDPVNVEVTFKGYGAPGSEMTGPIGQVTTMHVVPEFGTIAMMILAVSIISIVAVTAKSKVIPRF